MISNPHFPEAQDFTFTPHLSAEELRRVYRRLARKYHPDSGIAGSEEIMSHINALHDELKKQIEARGPTAEAATHSGKEQPSPRPAGPAPSMRPDPHRVVEPSTISPELTRANTPDEDRLGALLLTEAARGLMSDALIKAVDAWLVCNRGVPRNALRRRMMVRMGRIGPVSCPGLHMPHSVSMNRRALRFHFLSTPVAGLNLVALPAMSNKGIALAPTGKISVLEECFETGLPVFSIPHFRASSMGFALEYDGHALPLELLFDGAAADLSKGLYRIPNRRFRGLFTPGTPPP